MQLVDKFFIQNLLRVQWGRVAYLAPVNVKILLIKNYHKIIKHFLICVSIIG